MNTAPAVSFSRGREEATMPQTCLESDRTTSTPYGRCCSLVLAIRRTNKYVKHPRSWCTCAYSLFGTHVHVGYVCHFVGTPVWFPLTTRNRCQRWGGVMLWCAVMLWCWLVPWCFCTAGAARHAYLSRLCGRLFFTDGPVPLRPLSATELRAALGSREPLLVSRFPVVERQPPEGACICGDGPLSRSLSWGIRWNKRRSASGFPLRLN